MKDGTLMTQMIMIPTDFICDYHKKSVLSVFYLVILCKFKTKQIS